MKSTVHAVSYPSTPSQETMQYMLKYSLHKQVMQIPMSVTVNRKLDFGMLKDALNTEIKRNDCLRLRFLKAEKKVRQYFLDEFTVKDVPIMHFADESERREYLGADAQKPVRFLKDEVFRIIFYTQNGTESGVYINVCHLNMDASAVFTFFSDLFAVYSALENKTELPAALGSFRDIIREEEKYLADSANTEKDEKFYREFFLKDGEPFYAGIHGHNLLDKARKKNPACRVPSVFDPIHDKAEMKYAHISQADASKINAYCSQNGFSPECVLQMGMRTHASAINYRSPDIYFMSLCSRRSTIKEKTAGGCMTQPLPARSVIPENVSFNEAVEQLYGIQSQLFRHMNYPYMDCRELVRKLYGYGPAASPSCMMFTWLPLDVNSLNGWDFRLDGYNLGRYIMPLYTFALPAPDGGIDLYYLYRTDTISAQQIESLHNNTVAVILKGIEKPETTVGELLDSIG